jgi:penicillin-binding protein 2
MKSETHPPHPRRRSSAGITSVLPAALLILITVVASGCSRGGENGAPPPPGELPTPVILSESAPDPGETAGVFLDALGRGDNAAMYAMLDSGSKGGLTEEAFAEVADGFRSGTAMVGLEHEIISSQVHSPYRASVEYAVNLQSAAVGEYPYTARMDLAREDGSWEVMWDRTILHPALTEDRKLRTQMTLPERGSIYDKDGTPLASPGDAAALWIVPNQIGDEDTEDLMLSRLRQLFDAASTNDILRRYDNVRGTDFYTALGEVALEEYQRFGGVLGDIDAVWLRTYDTRFYNGDGLAPYAGGYAPHAIGYVSWIPEAELDDYQKRGYLQDEFIGRMGLERAFDAELRGVPAGSVYLTDAAGNNLEILAQRPSAEPYEVTTTLDADLQKIAQEAIENFTGAAVVLERDTGRVLAMASSPGFDPNLFDPENPHGGWGLGQLAADPDIPYLNRATLGVYPPGSIFKIITMAAALESGEFKADDIYDCGLEFTDLPGVVLDDWRKEKEWDPAGEITLKQGLEYSCNPWFYHIGLELYRRGHTSAVPDMAKAFGLGQTTGIEIDEEPGLVPDPENKPEILGEEWSEYDHVGISYGQSYLQVTPLQVARYVAAVGNGGTLYRPQLVERIMNEAGDVVREFQPEAQAQLPVSPENLASIKEAMVNVVRNPDATAAYEFRNLNLNVAGKTGTATSGETTDPHAWFTAFTFEERENLPDIAVAVVLENQGEGSDWAAPVVRRIIEGYFRGRPILRYPWEEQIRINRVEEDTPEEETTQ